MKPFTKTLLVTVVIVAAYFLFSAVRGGTGTGIQFSADALELTALEKFTCTVPYKDIAKVELAEHWDEVPWTSLGNESRRYIWGLVRHEEFGSGVLCLTKKIENAVLITDTDGTQVLFNYESEETTIRIFEMLPDLIEEKQGSIDP